MEPLGEPRLNGVHRRHFGGGKDEKAARRSLDRPDLKSRTAKTLTETMSKSLIRDNLQLTPCPRSMFAFRIAVYVWSGALLTQLV